MKFLIALLFASGLVAMLLSCGSTDTPTPSNPAATKSSEKQITEFTFATLSPVVSATIDQATRTISVSIPGSLTALAPTISLSNKATVTPASGATQDFTRPVSYTVTAEDGSAQVYNVTTRSVSSSLRKPISELLGVSIEDAAKYPENDYLTLNAPTDPYHTLTKAEVDWLVEALNKDTRKFVKVAFVNPNIPDIQLWYTPEAYNGYFRTLVFSPGVRATIDWIRPSEMQYKYADGTVTRSPSQEHGILTNTGGSFTFNRLILESLFNDWYDAARGQRFPDNRASLLR